MTDVTLRAFRRDDLSELVALVNEADAVDQLEHSTTLEELEHGFYGPVSDPTRDVVVAEAPPGRLVGYTRFFLIPGKEWSAHGSGIVHPDYRRQGIGRQLLAASLAQATERVRAEAPAGQRAFFQSRHDLRDEARSGLYQHFGFTVVRYFMNMLYPALEQLPEVGLPAGLALRGWAPELDDGMRRAFNESFSDHWGFSTEVPPEAWEYYFKGPGWQPELWLCVVELPAQAGDAPEVVGISLCQIDHERNARTGRREGYIGTVGVRRAWRNRGVASALLAASLGALREVGMQSGHLDVDAESLTGAQRLYERLGFRERGRAVAYQKPILS